MRLTGVPRTRFSRHQARWGGSIRYMVAHMQTIGDRKWIVLSGFSWARRLTRCSSVPTPQVEPAGADEMVLMMNSVEPTRSAASTTCIMHSGWTRILLSGNRFAELLDVIGLEHLMDRAVASPEQDPAGGDRGFGVSAQRFARVPDGHLVEGNAHGAGRVAAQVLVGKKQDAPALGERPVEHGSGVGAGANDAAVPSAEGLEVGGRINIGYGGDVVGVDDHRPRSCQAASTDSRSAMSAMLHPAARSGR